MSQLLIVLIVVPLLAVPLRYFTALLIEKHVEKLLVVVSAFMIVPTLLLLLLVNEEGIIYYNVGGWNFNQGIVLVADHLSVLMVLLIQVLCWLTLVFSCRKSVEGPDHFTPLLFLLQAGLNGMVLTGDIFNMYVFIEITAIVSYALVASRKTKEGLEGGLKYLVLGSVGSLFILWGIGLVYASFGSLNLAFLAQVAGEAPAGVRASILALFLAGFALKFGLFPVHFWKPDAYGASPPAVSALLSGVGSKVPIYAMLRIVSLLFGWSYLRDVGFGYLLAGLGLASIIVGHLMAYQQERLRRLLAYSSVAHIGYIAVALGAMSQAGVEGALFHILNHGILKAGLFFATGAILAVMGTERIGELQGLNRRAPLLSASFAIMALGMIGIPPVNGFLSKWVIVMATMEAGYYLPAFTVVLGGLIAMSYYIRIIIVMYTPAGTSDEHAQASFDVCHRLPVYTLTAMCLLIFVFGSGIMWLMENGAVVAFYTEPYISAVLGG